MAEKTKSNREKLARYLFAPTRQISRRRLLLGGAITSAVAATPTESRPDPLPAARRKMHLGIVTYNVAKDRSLDQILPNSTMPGIEGVESRTTQQHRVQPPTPSY